MSANGRVIPHTPLAVDFWQVRKCPRTRLFFLSHMHSDHTVGLTSTWSNRPIYCSPTTATLLRLRLKVKEQWIHPLELDEPYLLPLDDIGKESMTVTLIDANHCPGSVMFLFEGYFGSILYTGDFRYIPSMLREPSLRTNTTIDVLYLDNTNSDPNRTIPSRHHATQQIKEIIRRHPGHSVVIGLYALGKESLLCDLAMEFQTWIEVSVARMETLRILKMPNVFTTDPGAGRIRVVEQSEISCASFHQWNREEPTLAILPTSRPVVSFHPDVYVVPYSDHSSYQELEDFVSALKPTTVVPIVGNHIPGSLSALVRSKKRHNFLVPESVQNYMSRQSDSHFVSSTSTSLCHRHFHPIAPKGVIFESPVRGSRNSSEQAWDVESLEDTVSEEEMDTETSEKDSDCILVDLSTDLVPKKHRRRNRNTWSLNIVKKIPEDVAMAESVPFSQLTQSNFVSATVLPNAKACLKPIRTRRKPFKINAKTNEETAVNDRNQQSRHGQAHDIQSLSDSDGVCQQSGDVNDQEDDMSNENSVSKQSGHVNDQDDVMSNENNMSQQSGHDHNNRVRRSIDNESCAFSNSLTFLRQEYLEQVENSILSDLPFTEVDFKTRGLLQARFVKQFPLSPICDETD